MPLPSLFPEMVPLLFKRKRASKLRKSFTDLEWYEQELVLESVPADVGRISKLLYVKVIRPRERLLVFGKYLFPIHMRRDPWRKKILVIAALCPSDLSDIPRIRSQITHTHPLQQKQQKQRERKAYSPQPPSEVMMRASRAVDPRNSGKLLRKQLSSNSGRRAAERTIKHNRG